MRESEEILAKVKALIDGQPQNALLDEARYQYKRLIRSRVEHAPPEQFNPKNEMYEEGDEHARFFSEGFLYTLLGKDDARSVLGWVHAIGKGLGLSDDEIDGRDDFEYRDKTEHSFGDRPWWWDQIWNTELPSTHVFIHPITGEKLPLDDKASRTKYAMGLLEFATKAKGQHGTRSRYLNAIHFIHAFWCDDEAEKELKRVQEQLRGDEVDVSWQP